MSYRQPDAAPFIHPIPSRMVADKSIPGLRRDGAPQKNVCRLLNRAGRAQWNMSIADALAALDVNQHRPTVDVLDLQAPHLRVPHSRNTACIGRSVSVRAASINRGLPPPSGWSAGGAAASDTECRRAVRSLQRLDEEEPERRTHLTIFWATWSVAVRKIAFAEPSGGRMIGRASRSAVARSVRPSDHGHSGLLRTPWRTQFLDTC